MGGIETQCEGLLESFTFVQNVSLIEYGTPYLQFYLLNDSGNQMKVERKGIAQ